VRQPSGALVRAIAVSTSPNPLIRYFLFQSLSEPAGEWGMEPIFHGDPKLTAYLNLFFHRNESTECVPRNKNVIIGFTLTDRAFHDELLAICTFLGIFTPTLDFRKMLIS
jgi:hypothetical protein